MNEIIEKDVQLKEIQEKIKNTEIERESLIKKFTELVSFDDINLDITNDRVIPKLTVLLSKIGTLGTRLESLYEIQDILLK